MLGRHQGGAPTDRRDERGQLGRVLLPRRALDARRHVNPVRVQPDDRVGDVGGVEATRDEQPTVVDHPFGEPPVEHLARAGAGAVDQEVGATELLEPGDRRVAGAERLDRARNPRRDPLGVLDRLVPVQLHRAQPDGVGDLDHPARRLVAEHADGQHLRRQALHDVRDGAGRHLSR
jgi:hypothetical protein